ncbi:putative branched-chain amino acid aminotransferase [Lentithecium fluviatile CBS 122367]|uniref:Putative branched-chain amino acid aminotransferase n=1 Tax=Lentithecium fluviatile CBS 122367 TaxID=1168545 RepID=A0A6G1JJE8_9PLEO|nr:putative branched-chain amino acid aminotransferase [Lentithecium fluviatile CBS 122367]
MSNNEALRPPEFPPPPCADLDWNGLDFSVRNVNGHIESHYTVASGRWTEPKLVKNRMLNVDGLAVGLHYGQQVFEGMKAYRAPSGQINIFRVESHASRLNHSCETVSIPPPPYEHFYQCVCLAVAENAVYVPPHDANACLYIRPLIFGSGPQINNLPSLEYTFCVFVHPIPSLYGLAPLDAVILEHFDRAAPMGTGSAKVGGNYAPIFKWQQEAKSKGFGLLLHLDSKTRTAIDEFSTSSFVGVKNSDGATTLISPDSASVMKGVTSKSVFTLAEHFGWNFEIRPVRYEELEDFDEVMACGTAAGVASIKTITCLGDNRKFQYEKGRKDDYKCRERMASALQSIQRGLVPDDFEWCTIVLPPEIYYSSCARGLRT